LVPTPVETVPSALPSALPSAPLVAPLVASAAPASAGSVVAMPSRPAERRAWLFTHLAGAVGETLKRGAEDPIPPRQPLFDVGLDSILALELRERLERELGIGLKPTLLFTYPTLETLVDHLLTLLPDNRSASDPTDVEARLRAVLDGGPS
jgi:acyl carrier protein